VKFLKKLATPLFLIGCLLLGFGISSLVKSWLGRATTPTPSHPDSIIVKRTAPPPTLRGITLAADMPTAADDAPAAFSKLRALGANWVAFSPEIHSLADIQSTDAGLRATALAAGAAQFHVCYLPRFSFHGQSTPTRHEILLAVARHAKARGYDMLALGYQTGEASPVDSFWRPALLAARREFPGQLVYVATDTLYPYVDWWDTVDFVAVAGPFTISLQPEPTPEQLRLGYQAQLDTIGSIGLRESKPVLLFDVAHPASPLAATEPASRLVKTPRPDLQQACIQAAVETIRGESWLRGVFLATWHLDSAAAKTDPSALNTDAKLLQIIADEWRAPQPVAALPAAALAPDAIR